MKDIIRMNEKYNELMQSWRSQIKNCEPDVIERIEQIESWLKTQLKITSMEHNNLEQMILFRIENIQVEFCIFTDKNIVSYIPQSLNRYNHTQLHNYDSFTQLIQEKLIKEFPK